MQDDPPLDPDDDDLYDMLDDAPTTPPNKYVRGGMMANEADESPEEIVEHLAELGFHSQDDDPQDGRLDDVLEDVPTTPPNYYGDHPGCKITVHKPKPR